MKNEEDIITCSCGILLNLERAKENQYDYNKIRQKVYCPACKYKVWEEEA